VYPDLNRSKWASRPFDTVLRHSLYSDVSCFLRPRASGRLFTGRMEDSQHRLSDRIRFRVPEPDEGVPPKENWPPNQRFGPLFIGAGGAGPKRALVKQAGCSLVHPDSQLRQSVIGRSWRYRGRRFLVLFSVQVFRTSAGKKYEEGAEHERPMHCRMTGRLAEPFFCLLSAASRNFRYLPWANTDLVYCPKLPTFGSPTCAGLFGELARQYLSRRDPVGGR